MALLGEVLEKIESYHNDYRNSKLKRFLVSKHYDLFPDKTSIIDKKNCWPSTWHNTGKAGVYLILNNHFEVIYIGKSDCLGPRLSSYFHYDDSKNCKIIHKWYENDNPRYVVTVAVPDSSKFENVSLEAFLLSQFKTKNNRLGHKNIDEMLLG